MQNNYSKVHANKCSHVLTVMMYLYEQGCLFPRFSKDEKKAAKEEERREKERKRLEKEREKEQKRKDEIRTKNKLKGLKQYKVSGLEVMTRLKQYKVSGLVAMTRLEQYKVSGLVAMTRQLHIVL